MEKKKVHGRNEMITIQSMDLKGLLSNRRT